MYHLRIAKQPEDQGCLQARVVVAVAVDLVGMGALDHRKGVPMVPPVVVVVVDLVEMGGAPLMAAAEEEEVLKEMEGV